MRDYSICKRAIEVEGKNIQNYIAIEELSELQQAVCRKVRGRESNIAEEIADVRIILKQLEILNSCEEEAERHYWSKIERMEIRFKRRSEE